MPLVFTDMVGVVAPVLQVPLMFPDKMTDCPSHNKVLPFAVIVGANGSIPMVTTLLWSEIAPALDKALPNKEDPSNKLMAPLTSNVPLKTLPSPKANAPLTCQ